ncbi:MAG: hypothetical protein J7647_12745 [Cyanobacteria bacterium SBLK]|nr:hypothetical protein [Cyanobacteria bacterium SBLK]
MLLAQNPIKLNQPKSNWWNTLLERFSIKRDKSLETPQTEDKLILHLSEEDSKIIYSAMMNPPEPSDELRALFK